MTRQIRPHRARRPGGAPPGGALALIAALVLIGFIGLVVASSSHPHPAPTERADEPLPAPTAAVSMPSARSVAREARDEPRAVAAVDARFVSADSPPFASAASATDADPAKPASRLASLSSMPAAAQLAPVDRRPVGTEPPPSAAPAPAAGVGSTRPIDDPAEIVRLGETAFRKGSFWVPCEVSDSKYYRCHYLTPLDDRGQVTARGKIAVYFMHFPMDPGFYRAGGMFERVARECGLTVFGVSFDNMGPDRVDVEDKQHCYYYRESGAFAAVKAACEHMRAEMSMPPPYLLIGESGGGSAALNVSEAMPEWFDAAAMTGGRRYASTTNGHAAWLILHTREDVLTPENIALVGRMREKGLKPLYLTTQPEWFRRGQIGALFEHCPDEHARRLQLTYLSGVAELKLANKGRLPPPESWPVLADVRQSDGTSGPARFPSRACLEEWLKNPPPMETIPVGQGRIRLVRPAPATPPKGIVVYLESGAPDDPLERRYDLNFLAASGYVACATASVDRAALARELDLAREQVKDSATLPIYFIGYGPNADIVAFANSTSAQRRHVAGAAFFDVDGDALEGVAKVLKGQGAPKANLLFCTNPGSNIAGGFPAGLVEGEKIVANAEMPAIYQSRVVLASKRFDLWSGIH